MEAIEGAQSLEASRWGISHVQTHANLLLTHSAEIWAHRTFPTCPRLPASKTFCLPQGCFPRLAQLAPPSPHHRRPAANQRACPVCSSSTCPKDSLPKLANQHAWPVRSASASADDGATECSGGGSSGVSSGVAAGIGIGCAVGGVLIAAIVTAMVMKKKSRWAVHLDEGEHEEPG